MTKTHQASLSASAHRPLDPFTRLRRLAADREYHDALSLLDVVDDSAFSPNRKEAWPLWTFLEILKRPCDQTALIRLMPLVQRYIELEDVGSGAQIARLLLKRIRITRVMVLLPIMMDVMLWKLEAAYTDGQVDLDDAMSIISSLLGVLRQFRYFSRINDEHAHTTDLPPIIHDQILRLATLAIHTAESVPSSSSAESRKLISRQVRQRLFDRVFLTPQIRNLLLAHLPSEKLLASECRSCVKSVIAEGGKGAEERAKRFTKLAQAAERRSAKLVEKARLKAPPDRDIYAGPEIKSPRGRSLEDRDEWERAISSVILRKSATSDFQDSLTTIDRITLARCGQNTHSLLESLEPFLPAPTARDDGTYDSDESTVPSTQPYDLSNRRYAWSILVHQLSSSTHTASSELLDIAFDLEDELSSPQIVTPIITGLASRKQLNDAWAIFNDLAKKQEGAEHDRYIDRELLAAITPVCDHLYGFEAAVSLVDQWGRRLGIKTSSEAGTTRHSITLDAVNLNALLYVCVKRQQPSVALRLFAAAQPRWGVWADHISLNLLIDCCRFAHSDPISETDTIRTRLRDLVSEMRLFHSSSSDSASSSTDPYAAYDIAGFGKGDHRVLLDAPGIGWRGTLGNTRPWQAARQIFRDVCLGNWPHLVNIRSPLEFGAFARLDDILCPYPPPEPGESRLPLSSARYTHIIPAASTFQSYISLLGYYGMTEEIPLVLAWAREIGVQPNWRSMCSAMAYIGETEGPRRRVRGWKVNGQSLFVRDEQILRRWLECWVKGPVPTEEEVAAFVRMVRERGGKMRIRE